MTEPAPPLPALILNELARRAGLAKDSPGAPWPACTVLRPKPKEQTSPAHGQMRVITTGPPKPQQGIQKQYSTTNWSFDVVVTGYIFQGERAEPAEGEEVPVDTRLNEDDLGLAGCNAILFAVKPSQKFDSSEYQQLCDTVDVVATSYGQEEGGEYFGCSVTFRFTFDTSADSWRLFGYPLVAP